MKILTFLRAWVWNLEIPIASLTAWLKTVDEDGNGKISVREIVRYIKVWFSD